MSSTKTRPVLTDEECARLEEAVAVAERGTRGEIVPMVVRAADTYPGARWRLAVALALVGVTVAILVGPALDPLWYVLALVPLGLVGHALATLPPLLRLGLRRHEVEEEVQQRARQAFYELGLHATRERTGVLILVSLLERRIEVVADQGIDAVAPDDLWTDMVERLARRIGDGHLADGMVEAIARCGDQLATHFPRRDDDTNELPNRVVLE